MKINEVTKGANLPTVTFPKGKLFHVGKMNKALKRKNSLEGRGLSVSTQPNEWATITSLPGNIYSIHKNGNKFIDARSLSNHQIEQIQNWAIQDKLIEPSTIYRYTFSSGEDGEEMYTDATTKDELIRDYDAEEDEITVINNSIKPTQKLKQLSMNHDMTGGNDTIDYVLPLYAEYDNYDGVWWNDTLDVLSYSAPRGVIVPSKIKEFDVEDYENK